MLFEAVGRTYCILILLMFDLKTGETQLIKHIVRVLMGHYIA